MRMKLRALGIGFLLVGALALHMTQADAVVGGSEVPQGKYPFVGALLYDGSQICGGSVVASQWFLTAAHCVVGDAASHFSVSVGNVDYTQGHVINATSVTVHPNYNPDNSSNDAALIHLASAAGVTPIRLAGSADDALEADGASAVVAGWGSQVPIVGEVPPVDSQQREAALQIVGDAQCFGNYELIAPAYGGSDPATQVCAAALLKDSCQGDSGGPLFAATATGRVQIGIVSNGLGCAVPEFAGVYSEVNAPSIRNWISATAGV
jgi:trypsin